MGASYIPLIEINTKHNYFKEGTTDQISYVPTDETLKLLKRFRLKLNNTPSGFKIYFQSIDGTNPTIDFSELKFTFVVALTNPTEFINYTILDTNKDFQNKNKIYFSNENPTRKKIRHSVIDQLRSKVFTYFSPLKTENIASEKLNLSITEVNGTNSFQQNDIDANDNGEFLIPLTLNKFRSGLYRFSSINTTNNETSEEFIYLDDILSRQPTFGIVELFYGNDSLDEYKLIYRRKSNVWNYILVNRNNRSDFQNLLIKDNGITVDPYDQSEFEKENQSIEVGGIEAVRFRSAAPIPFFEEPKKDIEIVKELNGNNELVLLKNLSNPPLNQISSNKNESDIYVFV